MLRNVKDAWWRSMVQLRDDVVLLDAAILGPPQIWEASGHLANFTDPLVDCTNCKERFRLDKLDDPDTCPSCGKNGTFTEARQFNLMFKTHAGPVEDAGAVAYLRPGDGAGHVRQLHQRAADSHAARSRRSASPRSARPSATRSRRGTSSSAPASSSRWRWSSSCRPPTAPKWYEYWCNERLELVRRPRHPDGHAAPARPRRRRAVALLGRHVRRRVPVPVGLGRARGHRPAHRLRPHAARRSTRARSSTTSTRRPTSATCRT